MKKPEQHNEAGGAVQRRDGTVADAQPAVDAGADALNDARALQQMIEGTPDATDEFRRIEQKR